VRSHDREHREIVAIAGVAAVALGRHRRDAGAGTRRHAAIFSWVTRYFVTTPSYFRTAGILIRAGRDFTAADDAAHAGVAIVSETFAVRFWNTTDAIGRRLETQFPRSDAFWVPRERREWLTVVGVVDDIREDGLADSAGFPQLYLMRAARTASASFR
jgi:MacB-like periplasmic core domain